MWRTDTDMEQEKNSYNGCVEYRKLANKTAVIHRDVCYSYRALWRRVSEISESFLDNGVIRGDHVAVHLHRDIDLIATIFAIWEVGAVYIPLDPTHPAAHSLKVISTSKAKFVVFNHTLQSKELIDRGGKFKAHVLPQTSSSRSDTLPFPRIAPFDNNDCAYIMFTSGSTGEPKGVEISHKALNHFSNSIAFIFALKKAPRVLASTTTTFDISIFEIVSSIRNFVTVVLIDNEQRLDPAKMISVINDSQANILMATPSHWQAILECEEKIIDSVIAIAIGEPLSKQLARKLMAQNFSVFNGFGPTESTVNTMVFELQQEDVVGDGVVDIAGSLSACGHVVITPDKTISPDGEGELAIFGETLALGYFNNPDITNDKFITIDIGQGLPTRVYRTGDRVRRIGEDRYAFLGRIDRQVKIDGYRIELEYIEQQVLAHPSVEQCAVSVYKRSQRSDSICLFYSTSDDCTEPVLRDYLSDRLPKYMLPSLLFKINSLPVNARGKVDYKALNKKLESLNVDFYSRDAKFQHSAHQLINQFFGENVQLDKSLTSQGFSSLDAVKLVNRLKRHYLNVGSPGALLNSNSILDWLKPLKESVVGNMHYGASDSSETYAIATKSQQSMYHLDELYGGSAQYNLTRAFLIKGDITDTEIVAAIQAEFQQHDALFMHLIYRENNVCLEKNNSKVLPIQRFQIEDKDYSRAVKDINSKPIALGQQIPVQIYLSDTEESTKLLVIKIHHYAIDGWSFNKLITGLNNKFKGEVAEQEIKFEYLRYTVYQRHFQKNLTFWQNYLNGAPETHNLYLDKKRPAVQSFKGSHLRAQLPSVLADKIKQFCISHKISEFNCYSCLFSILIGEWSRSADIVIGSPFSNRHSMEAENTVGYFAQFLPLRYRFDRSQPLLAYMQHNVKQQYQVFDQQETHFEDIVESVNPQRNTAFNALTQLAFVIQPTPRQCLNIPGNNVEEVSFETGFSKFDVLLELEPSASGYALFWEYSTDIFSEHFIERLNQCFLHYCRQVEKFDSIAIGQLTLPVQSCRNVAVPANKPSSFSCTSVVERFNDIAKTYPANIAIADDTCSLTYSDMCAKAKKLAVYLINEQGVCIGDRVIVSIARNHHLGIVILGVMMAGATYVPVDPDYPEARKQHIVDDCKARCVITDQIQESILNVTQVAHIEQCLTAIAACQEETVSLPGISGNSTAYIIYTSGSTGKPKGVVVSHQNLLRLMTSTASLFEFDSQDTWLLFHSYSFDFSIWEMWGAWFYGGKLRIIDVETSRQPQLCADLISKEKVTVLNQTPSAFYMLMDSLLAQHQSIRYVIFGGEALKVSKLNTWFESEVSEKVRLVNMYGITETTVHTTFREITRKDVTHDCSPIGQCLPDLHGLVLNQSLHHVPDGLPGELVIFGEGVAQGYLNQPMLTDARFIDAKKLGFSGKGYRSGDLVRYSYDGSELEYIGRIDNQVKIRGYRIELGEVESAIRKIEHINDAVVLAKSHETGEKYLVAFIVGKDTDERLIRAALLESLPKFMVPQEIVPVVSFPINSNGKVDHKRLLESALSSRPALGVESTGLTSIIEKVLNRKKVLLSDNFFRLGGDSILSLRVVSEAKRAGYELELVDLYKYETFEQLLPHVGKQRDSETKTQAVVNFYSIPESVLAEIKDDSVEDIYPLSALQLSMLSDSMSNESSNIYHDVFNFEVEAKDGFNVDRMVDSVTSIVSSQFVLRTKFALTSIGYVQKTILNAEPQLEVFEDCADPQKAIQAWIKEQKLRGFDFSTDYLYRFGLFVHANGTLNILMSFHHAILDGWSVASLIKELFRRYQDADYAAIKLPNLFKNNIFEEQRNTENPDFMSFWKNETKGAVASIFPYPLGDNSATKKFKVLEFDQQRSAHLLSVCKSNKLSPVHYLYALHLHTLRLLTGFNNIASCAVTGIRPACDFSDEVYGLFLNSLPICVDTTDLDVFETAECVKSKLALQLQYRNYPLANIQKDSGLVFSDVLFNYTHFHIYRDVFDSDIQLRNFDFFEEINFKLYVHFTRSFDDDRLTLNLVYDPKYLNDQLVDSYITLFEKLLSSEDVYKASNLITSEIATTGTVSDSTNTYRCLNEMFIDKFACGGTDTALSFGGKEYSYHALSQKINNISEYLVNVGANAGAKVAIELPRSLEQYLSIIATLNIGAIYIPVPLEYPLGRRHAILKDAKPDVLITSGGQIHVDIQQLLSLPVESGEMSLNRYQSKADDLACVLYTSGTSGKPKGVCLPQKVLLNLMPAQSHLTGILAEKQSTLQFASAGFDVSLQEILTAIDSQSALYIVSDEEKNDISALVGFIKDNALERLFLPNAVLQVFCQFINENAIRLEHLKVIVTAGEKLEVTGGLKAFFSLHSARLINHYGPTETHVVSAYLLPQNVETWGKDVPIGSQLPGCSLLIVGDNKELVAEGIPGELWVSGECLSRGYLNLPDLNKDKFITKFGNRWYRTGDLVRKHNGLYEYVGRVDRQVKVRGVRIELAEVESVLVEHSSIESAYVMPEKEGGITRLHAFYVASQEVNRRELNRLMAASLAEPVSLCSSTKLQAYPINQNGKIDQAALRSLLKQAKPAPDLAIPEFLSDVEQWLVSQVKEMLATQNVSITDDFYELGGHSLFATQLSARIQKDFGCHLSMVTIFQAESLKDIADLIELSSVEFKSEDSSVNELIL